jgi:glycogen operon protein
MAGDQARAEAQLETLDPATRRLAVYCTLAVRVQPTLLRALRLRLAPELTAATESDLWWSAIVASRSPDAVTFSTSALRRLRVDLESNRQEDPEALVMAHELVARHHVNEAPALQLEEEISWLSLWEGEAARERIDRLLAKAVVSLVEQGNTGVADWWPGAHARMSDLARSTDMAIRLSILTSPLLDRDAVAIPEDVEPVLDGLTELGLRHVRDVAVGVLRVGDMLSIGEVDRARGAALLVPDTHPRLLELEWESSDEEGGFANRQIVALARQEVVRRDVGRGMVRVRTARGSVYEVPPDLNAASFVSRAKGFPPLGAIWAGNGTTFSVYTGIADRVELCLFDEDGAEHRLDLEPGRNSVWRAHPPEVRPGRRYGYRVHGPHDPGRGHRCNASKLLVDPYSRAIAGQVDFDRSLFSYSPDDPQELNEEDSAPHTMRSVVVDPAFDWGDDRRPGHAAHETVLYEAHVKGLTVAHPKVPTELRGTYAGLAHPAVLEHLLGLGVTAVELMPVQQFIVDPELAQRGLANYWGYSPIGVFAPHNAYSASGQRGQQVVEFKSMVKALHDAGIEVILDVAYAYTGEGGRFGRTLCLRGVDTAAYYRLVDADPARYYDTTGTGNTMLMRHPRVLQLILDSMRYWVAEMHVDGFRFDRAASRARQFHEVDRLSAFFGLVQQDPSVNGVRLIAEPWDVGDGGYQVGNFPAQWSEWNGRYRDTVRDFWRGEASTLGEFASRLSGSADLYEHSGRRPSSSINFVASHDGFTLRDLVSYQEKHNEANGEQNLDGESHNRSWNCGVEGETDDPEVLELRARQQRNFLATLFLSQGVPLLQHGDELGRTQRGNNNAYGQDNERSWVDWELEPWQRQLLEFTRAVSTLRKQHPVFRRRRFLTGAGDTAWFRPDGAPMGSDDWTTTGRAGRGLALYLDGDAIAEPNHRGERVMDDSAFVLVNPGADELRFTLPVTGPWKLVLDTAEEALSGRPSAPGQRAAIPVRGHSVVVLIRPQGATPGEAPTSSSGSGDG